MKHSNRYSPELRERAVRLVLDHQGAHESQWAAIGSVSSKIGCSAETLRKWVRQAERDEGVRPGLTSAEGERLKALERENRELRRANEILRKASAYFAPPLGDCTAITCRATGRSSTADPSHDVVHQFAPRAMWSSQHSTGSTGSTTDGSSSRSGTAHRPRPKRRTITNSNTRRWPRDSHKMVSGIPGAVHRARRAGLRPGKFQLEATVGDRRYAVLSQIQHPGGEGEVMAATSAAWRALTERYLPERISVVLDELSPDPWQHLDRLDGTYTLDDPLACAIAEIRDRFGVRSIRRGETGDPTGP